MLPLTVYEGAQTHSSLSLLCISMDRSCVCVETFLFSMQRFPTRSSKNSVFFPFPTIAMVTALNSANESFGMAMVNSLQGLLRSTLCNQAQWVYIAMLSHLRIGMPRPPAHFIMHTSSQAMEQFPPLASALPHHRKPVIICSWS